MHPPPTRHPPINCYSSTAVQQHVRQYAGTRGAFGWLSSLEDLVRNGGKLFFFYDPPPSRGASEAPPLSTHHPPPTTHPPTYPPQQHNKSAAVRADQSTTAAHRNHSTSCTRGAACVGDFHFLTVIRLPGESASRPRESVSALPARRVGNRRPLCRWGHGGVMCETAVARA